ncbi:uncharacterized protein TNCV_531021 [Trichonephila clavipes]|nr:uncharacterized protein TNCV_531021 [Trichonephila clavipes]
MSLDSIYLTPTGGCQYDVRLMNSWILHARLELRKGMVARSCGLGCFLRQCLGSLVRLPTSLNSIRYLELLGDHFHSFMLFCYPHGNGVFSELQEILNEEHQETQRNVSPSEQEEDERGPMPTSAIKDLLKKWVDVRAMVLECHPKQADVRRVGDIYNNNAINYF